MRPALAGLLFLPALLLAQTKNSGVPNNQGPTNRGWYRSPALYGNTIAFTAEGDLWLVGAEGGLARRLTTNPGNESPAVFSPDGITIAFSADYEGTDRNLHHARQRRAYRCAGPMKAAEGGAARSRWAGRPMAKSFILRTTSRLSPMPNSPPSTPESDRTDPPQPGRTRLLRRAARHFVLHASGASAQFHQALSGRKRGNPLEI